MAHRYIPLRIQTWEDSERHRPLETLALPESSESRQSDDLNLPSWGSALGVTAEGAPHLFLLFLFSPPSAGASEVVPFCVEGGTDCSEGCALTCKNMIISIGAHLTP